MFHRAANAIPIVPVWRGWMAGMLLFVLGADAGAATGDYLMDVWSAENGLPNSSVTAIAQTPDGYLWVGTYNGLARFDGVRFVNFDPFTTPELAHPRVRRLFVDDGGTMWANTFDGSLSSYRNGKFKLEWKGDGSPDAWVTPVSLRTNRVIFLLYSGEMIMREVATNGVAGWRMVQSPGFGSGETAVEDGDGVVWCRGRDQKLWRFDGMNFLAVPADAGLQGQVINCLVTDAKGRVWVGTDRELARWEGGRFVSQTPTNGEAVLNVANISVGSNGEVWVFAENRVRKARGREWVLEPDELRDVFTGRLERMGVQEDRAGGSWIYHYGKGLFHVRADGRTRAVAKEENFPGERVDCFYEDHEGNLWSGVDRGGLVRLREKRFTVLQPGNDAAGKAAVTVAEDAAGAVWVGTFGGGLYRWSDGGWQNFSLTRGAQRGFVFSVFPGAGGNLWVSAGDEDLYSHTQGQFHAFSPAVHGVKSLLVARDGKLWIGTKNGLACWTDGRLRQFQPEDGIERVDIRAVVEDARGVVWAGAGNGTLYRIETNKVTFFRAEGLMAGEPVWSLAVDADGSVWVGTFRGGLLHFRDGRFVRYSSRDGLPDDVICQILDAGDGQLWVGSQKGIFRVAKSELKAFSEQRIKSINCTAYGRFDGLPSLECSGNYQPACWRARDGRLLFATLKGVVSVQPQELTPNRLPPPVMIEEALVDGGPEALARKTSPVGTVRGSSWEVLKLPPGKRQVELRYTGLSFASPDRVRFRYKLEGLDEDWVEAGTRRTAQYSFLRPGHYTFRVTACNNDGVWNDHSASLPLTVLPYFYETSWFLALVIVASVGLVAIVVRRVVVSKLRRHLEFLERQRAVERDRTRIAKDIHDDLGAGLTHISLLTELAQRTPKEEAAAHLGQISDMARELTRGMDEIVWAVDPQNDTLDSLLDYLCKYAQEYLSVAGIRCRLDLPLQVPPWALSAEVRHNLFLAFKEVLNNIVKHAGATEVWLRLALGAEEFTLTMEDNGCGITPDGKDSDVPRPGRISSGRGLSNLEKRLSAIGGRCIVSSEPEKGTRIGMTINLSARHHPKWR